MKKLLLLLLTVVSFFRSQSQSPNFQWAKSFGNTQTDQGMCIETDTYGNIITTGFYTSVIDFDPGPGTFTLNSNSGSFFISKLDPYGNFIWAKTIGDSGQINIRSTDMDSLNNFYATGFFNMTVDFDPGPGTYTLSSLGARDAFILKLDANGNFVWAIRLGDTGLDFAEEMFVDKAGNVYTTGQFDNTVDFDPGPGTYNLSVSSREIYILKLNSNATLAWARNIGGSAVEEPYAINVDKAGSVYTSGRFFATMDMDPGPASFLISTAGNCDVFVSKLDNSGNFVWGKSFGGTSCDEVYASTIDNNGNIYLTGDFMSTPADFDPGTGVYNINANSGGLDGFVVRLDKNGNFNWAGAISGFGAETAYAISYNNAGGLLLTGFYSSPTDFDMSASTYTLPIFGYYDIFMTKMDTLGNLLWAEGMGGSQSEGGNDIVQDAFGNILSTGLFQSTALDFDFSSGTYSLSSNGSYDCYIHKINTCATPTVFNITPPANQTLCSNISATLMASSTGTISWYSSLTSTTVLGSGTVFTTATLSPGTYTFYAEAENCNNLSPRTPITLTVSVCLGVEDPKSDNVFQFSIYPNPAYEQITITSPKKISSLDVTDALGKIIFHFEKIDSTDLKINTNSLPQGIYFVRISGEQGYGAKKFVKQ